MFHPSGGPRSETLSESRNRARAQQQQQQQQAHKKEKRGGEVVGKQGDRTTQRGKTRRGLGKSSGGAARGSRRSSSDMRSPPTHHPSIARNVANHSKPDFITQTDKYGNASTPRSEGALLGARRKAEPLVVTTSKQQQQHNAAADPAAEDACGETLLDSIRLMCCCVESGGVNDGATTTLSVNDEDDAESESGGGIPKLLPPLHPEDEGKKCLVLDLDETLVHSSFRAVPGADFVIPVQIEDVVHFVYVAKRPGVDDFLTEMAKHYEIVVYTASLNKYADPLLDLLDPHRTIRSRLFRESCVYYEGNYVKDLSLLDRPLSQTIIVDNSPSSYIFQPENAIDCSSFIDDPKDRELDQIGDFLVRAKAVADVRVVCQKWRDWR